jgi:hypothetical protein
MLPAAVVSFAEFAQVGHDLVDRPGFFEWSCLDDARTGYAIGIP